MEFGRNAGVAARRSRECFRRLYSPACVHLTRPNALPCHAFRRRTSPYGSTAAQTVRHRIFSRPSTPCSTRSCRIPAVDDDLGRARSIRTNEEIGARSLQDAEESHIASIVQTAVLAVMPNLERLSKKRCRTVPPITKYLEVPDAQIPAASGQYPIRTPGPLRAFQNPGKLDEVLSCRGFSAAIPTYNQQMIA